MGGGSTARTIESENGKPRANLLMFLRSRACAVVIIGLLRWVWPARHYLHALQRWARFGDVVRVSWWRRLYLVNDPAIMKLLCQSKVACTDKKTFRYRQFARCMGSGMVTADGAAWKAARQRCVSAFWPQALQQYDPQVIRHVNAWLLAWQEYADQGVTVNLHHETAMRIFALNAELLLGPVISHPEAWYWYQQMTELTDQAMAKPWRSILKQRNYVRCVQDLDAWILRQLQMNAHHTPLLQPLIDAWQARHIDRSALLGEVKNILFASYDTTTLALTWCFFRLTKSPFLQQRVSKNIQSSLLQQTSLSIYQNSFAVRSLIQETLRFYPSAYGLERRVTSTPHECRHVLPKRCTVLFSPYLMHHDPRYWQHPDAFFPDRFMHPLRERHAYLPFLYGPRNCIGQHLSNAIMARVIGSLLPAVRFLPDGRCVTKMSPRLTLRPATGVYAQMRLPKQKA
jgi:cytochrome P450